MIQDVWLFINNTERSRLFSSPQIYICFVWAHIMAFSSFRLVLPSVSIASRIFADQTMLVALKTQSGISDLL